MTTKEIVVTYIIVYCSIWAFLFLMGLLFGKLLKKDIIGAGVKCGICNSFFLSAVWPITMLCVFLGWCYDVWQAWKRL